MPKGTERKGEEQPQIVEGRLRCQTSAQFLMKYLALNIEGEETLSSRDILERVTKLEEENPDLLWVYGGSERSLGKDLVYLEALGMIKAEEGARVSRASEITISELGRYFATLFKAPEALKPALEAEIQSS